MIQPEPSAAGIEVIDRPELLTARLARLRRTGASIGLVPTMGALHEGHASLVRAAREASDVVVATIFVNPLQFGAGEDLDAYPRTMDADRALLEDIGCDLLFAPRVESLYPDGFVTRVVQTGITEVLCGASRPGHFDGVLTVVMKLLMLTLPTRAYFGRKDFQQALAIRRMVRDLDVPVEIVTCPIVREADGLAMSSRNRYLGPEERHQALALRRAILAMDAAWRGGEHEVARLLAVGMSELDATAGVRTDYLELRDPDDLSAREQTTRAGDLVAVAAQVGPARLIDNGLLGQEQAP